MFCGFADLNHEFTMRLSCNNRSSKKGHGSQNIVVELRIGTIDFEGSSGTCDFCHQSFHVYKMVIIHDTEDYMKLQ